MNSRVLSNQQKKSPMRILGIVILLALVIYSGVLAYQKWKVNPNNEINQSELLTEQQFILNQSDVINTNWLRTLNPLVKNVEGRVIWSNDLQKGMMEFIGLPKIDNNQQYQLWVYDLIGKDTKPIFSTQFTQVISGKFLIPFSVDTLIKSPLKFELMLNTDGEEISQPLFLAQP